MYKRNIEALPCKHGCRGEALSITYSVRVFVALVTQHAKTHVPYYIAICELSGSTIFSTLPQTRHNFGEKKVIEHNTCLMYTGPCIIVIVEE